MHKKIGARKIKKKKKGKQIRMKEERKKKNYVYVKQLRNSKVLLSG